MIQRVRIAPVVRWCKASLRANGVIPAVRDVLLRRGFALIHTETMEQRRQCRFWRVAESDAREVMAMADLMVYDHDAEAYLCEHQLEMD